MQHLRHPPGESLCFPDASQCTLGIEVEAGVRIVPIALDKRVREIGDVARSKIESFGSGRWYDMSRVARQEQLPEPHGFGDEAAQRRDAFFDRGAYLEIFDG